MNKLPTICALLLSFYTFVSINGETVNRDIANESGDVSCNSFPCIINCNAFNSCKSETISCPTTGSGTCTLNINGDSGAEKAIINGNAATNIIINANAYESLWEAQINLGDINDLTINVVGSNKALQDCDIIINSMTGDLNFNANGDSKYAFKSGELTINGNVGGDINIIENTSGSVNANFEEMTLTVNGDIAGSALFQSKIDNGKQAFNGASMTMTGTINGDLTFLSGTQGSFYKNTITVNGDVNGHVLVKDTSNGGGGFRDASNLLTIYGSIGGDFTIIDASQNGKAGKNSVFRVSGDIGGNVLVKDITTGTINSDSYQNTEWYISYPDGIISGNVEFIEDANTGKGFFNSDYYIGNVNGFVLFEGVNDNGKQSFDNSDFEISSVGKDLTFSSNAYGTFSEGTITVNGDIGGNALFYESSNGGYGFYHKTINFNGDIGGNALFYDTSNTGRGFRTVTINSNGIIYGDLSFIDDNGYKSFKDATINVETVTGTATFVSGGERGFSTIDLNIESCPNVIFDTNGIYNIWNSKLYFGENVGLIEITINSGKYALGSSTQIDAQYADEIILNCRGDSDCSDHDIKCPENNLSNKCRVYCDGDANCKDIDLFTTNGYCIDASFYCTASECTFGTSSQVFCITGTSNAYGSTGKYCKMDELGGQYICEDNGSSQCSQETFCPDATVTPAPTTPAPTTPAPTTSAPTTKPITDVPTLSPTFEPCSDDTVELNINFVLDKSGYISQFGFGRIINFVQALISYSINDLSKISALSYSDEIEDLYYFMNDQTSRDGVLNVLDNERYNYAGDGANTYDAMLRAIDMFSEDGVIENPSGNLMFLVTPGYPDEPLCDSSTGLPTARGNIIIQELEERNIDLHLVGIGGSTFDRTQLECLTSNKIKRVAGFGSDKFKAIEEEIRYLLCPNN